MSGKRDYQTTGLVLIITASLNIIALLIALAIDILPFSAHSIRYMPKQMMQEMVHSNIMANESRDFLFQIDNVKTKNQGGQMLTLYFHYRYDQGITTAAIPDYRTVRTFAMDYLNNLDVSTNPYWETINKGMCEEIRTKFPIQAISCQILVDGNTSSGLANEPGTHSSITTIGNITPLSLVK